MGFLKKSKQERSVLPEHESVSLDAAMSELTKQTEALLGKVGEEKSETSKKPTLPKRNKQPQSRGKSFDIIRNPNSPTKLRATLKAVEKTDVKIVEDSIEPEELLLPDHATKSYNEITPEDISQSEEVAVVTEPEDQKSGPTILHHEGSLALGPTEPDAASVNALNVVEAPKLKPEVAVSQIVSHESLSFTKEKDDSTEAAEESVSKDSEAAQPDNTESEAEAATGKTSEPEEVSKASIEKEELDQNVKDLEPVEDTAFTSGEIYANNLVKTVEPKGFQSNEGTEAPAVFDTTEYHPQLHDWSKLEHKNGSKWVLLLLLVIVAGLAGYFVMSGQTLPF